MAGHAMATHSAQRQQHEADQDAQLADMQQQQQAAGQYPAAPPPQYAPPPASPPQASATVPAQDPIETLKQLGELKAAGVLTDEEFRAKKAELLKQI